MSEDLLRELSDRFAREILRKFWWAELEDIRQETARVMLDALRLFDERVGVPLEAYLWRAASKAVNRYVLGLSTPVSAPKDRLGELRSIRRTPLDGIEMMVCKRPLPDDHLHRERVEHAMRKHVHRILGRIGAEIVMPVLTREEKSSTVASRMGMPLDHV
jgi:hypothetical protein